MAIRGPYDGRGCTPFIDGGLEGEDSVIPFDVDTLIDQIIQNLINNATFLAWLQQYLTTIDYDALYNQLYTDLYDAIYNQLVTDLSSGGTLYDDLYNALYNALYTALGGGGGGGGSGGPYSYAFDWGDGLVYPGQRLKIAIADATDFPANFSGSKCVIGSNPASTKTFSIRRGTPGSGTEIGQVSISSGGVVTFTSTGGTAYSINSGHGSVYIDPPATLDSSMSSVAITLKGTVP